MGELNGDLDIAIQTLNGKKQTQQENDFNKYGTHYENVLKLEEMGFDDREVSFKLLTELNGDLDIAIQTLFGKKQTQQQNLELQNNNQENDLNKYGTHYENVLKLEEMGFSDREACFQL